jgi:hypothetical protein
VAAKAAKMSCDEVAHAMETETAVRRGQRQVEQIVSGAAQAFDAFSAQPCSEDVQRQWYAQPIQVLTCDGKGGVRRQEAVREATRQQAAARAQSAPRGLAQKAKSNRKRLATVAGLYHIARHIRSPHTVARQCAPLRLVPSNPPPAPTPAGKKLWASLAKPMKAVLEATFAAGRRRDPDQRAAWVVFVDGDPTPMDAIKKTANAYGVSVVMLLDISDVLE